MASLIPKDRTVGALTEVWASIAQLISGLSAEQWTAASPLAGWDVRDNVSHMIGTEAMLLGIADPDVTVDREQLTHVRNDIGEFNEVWVEHLRSVSTDEIVGLWTDHTAKRIAALTAMPQDEWDAESFTPAGKDTYGRFMQIRVFDCWLHEQDIRDAVRAPGHEIGLAVDVTLDEMATALGFVVGKKAGLEHGQSVTFELMDQATSVRSFHVEVDGRAAVVESLSGPPTVQLAMPVGVMTRLCAGRVDVDSMMGSIDIAGDAELGRRIAASLAYTI